MSKKRQDKKQFRLGILHQNFTNYPFGSNVRSYSTTQILTIEDVINNIHLIWRRFKRIFHRPFIWFNILFFNSKLKESAHKQVEALTNTPLTADNPRQRPGYVIVPRPMAPKIIDVTPEERKQITQVAQNLQKMYLGFEDPKFREMLHIHAYRMLPDRILKILSDFATDFGYEEFGAICFRGLMDVDKEALGATPETWRETDFQKIQLYGFISALIHAAARAVPIEMFIQREGGGILHSVIPNTSMADTQTGEGFSNDLLIHTEDACLNNPADYVSFFYLYNEEEAPSMLHSIRSHDMYSQYMDTLFEQIFKCPLDGNYSGSNKTGTEKTAAILTGNPLFPFMRFDPAEQLSQTANQTPEAKQALEALWNDAKQYIYTDFIPKSGDMVFINNKIASHGRSAFLAGLKLVNGELVPCTKRWMLRMMSTANLMTFYEYAHPENPYLSLEKHYGDLFTVKTNEK